MNARKLFEPTDMELQLERVFQPVRPSRQFVQTVRKRIRLSPPVVVANRLNAAPQALMIVGGVITVTLVLAAAVRALFYLFNRPRA